MAITTNEMRCKEISVDGYPIAAVFLENNKISKVEIYYSIGNKNEINGLIELFEGLLKDEWNEEE